MPACGLEFRRTATGALVNSSLDVIFILTGANVGKKVLLSILLRRNCEGRATPSLARPKSVLSSSCAPLLLRTIDELIVVIQLLPQPGHFRFQFLNRARVGRVGINILQFPRIFLEIE